MRRRPWRRGHIRCSCLIRSFAIGSSSPRKGVRFVFRIIFLIQNIATVSDLRKILHAPPHHPHQPPARLLVRPADRRSRTREHYVPSASDLVHTRRRRHPQNRLGFALRLCVFRYPGRLIQLGGVIPEAMPGFIGGQLGITSTASLDYGAREATRLNSSAFSKSSCSKADDMRSISRA